MPRIRRGTDSRPIVPPNRYQSLAMKEVEAILQAWSELGHREPAVLATVVRVNGSAYRRPGARMLLLPDGRTIGTVSGGCLEDDVKLRAWPLTARGEPAVLRYDSTADGDIVWGLGLGCKSVIDLLIERLSPDRGVQPLDFLRSCLDTRQPGVLARVVAVEGRTGADVGAFLTLDETGSSAHDFAGPELVGLVRQAAAAALGERRSLYADCRLAAGRAEVFLEVVQPPPALLVCGAGHDASPLVRLAKELGWHVTVVDPRAAYATRERFPLANDIIVAAPEELLGRPIVSAWEAAVVMSHNYHNDLRFLRALLPATLRYLGVLGPKSRTESLLRDLAAGGLTPTARQMERLYGPVGLDIGANTPEEIALAVVAEIRAILAGRSGSPLRKSDRPIHDRPPDEIRLLIPSLNIDERVSIIAAD